MLLRELTTNHLDDVSLHGCDHLSCLNVKIRHPNCCPSFMHTHLCICASTKASKHGHMLLVSKTKLCKKIEMHGVPQCVRTMCNWFCSEKFSAAVLIHPAFPHNIQVWVFPEAKPVAHYSHIWNRNFTKQSLWLYFANNTKANLFCLFNGRHIFWLNCKLYTTLTLTRKFGLYSENLPSALSLFLCLRKSLLCKLLSHWAAQLPKKNIFLARSDTTKLIFEDKIWLLP